METYWQVGQQIVEFEQGGQAKAEYGAGLISRLAKDLTLRHGRGFSRSNLKGMRQFYLAYPKSQTLSGFLSWSHVLELLKIDDPLERGFYEQQMLVENWSVRELKRQKDTPPSRSAARSTCSAPKPTNTTARCTTPTGRSTARCVTASSSKPIRASRPKRSIWSIGKRRKITTSRSPRK
jgi:hypothetical protein